jgi:antitoxin component HigA of HigAB toxin-antitoxin module
MLLFRLLDWHEDRAMNDQDIIQRNQICIMRALARIVKYMELDDPTASDRQYSNDLWDASKETQEHLNWKLKSPDPISLIELAKATETRPWPDDLGGTEKEQWR